MTKEEVLTCFNAAVTQVLAAPIGPAAPRVLLLRLKEIFEKNLKERLDNPPKLE